MIVAGDLGGTKSNLGTFDPRDGKLVPIAKEHLDSHKYASVEELVQDYINQTKSIAARLASEWRGRWWTTRCGLRICPG